MFNELAEQPQIKYSSTSYFNTTIKKTQIYKSIFFAFVFTELRSGMASETVAGSGRESTRAKGLVWDVAIDSVAARRRQTIIVSPTTSAQSTQLEAPREHPPRIINRHHTRQQ